MKIARTNYKAASVYIPSPSEITEPALSPKNFMDASESAPLSPSSEISFAPTEGVLDNLLDKMAQYIEPASAMVPDADDIRDAARDVASDLTRGFRKVFENAQPEVAPANESADTSVTAPAPLVHVEDSGLKSIKLELQRMISSFSLPPTSHIDDQPPGVEAADVPLPPLVAESSFVPLSAADNVKAIKDAISRMQTSISTLSWGTVDERPPSPPTDTQRHPLTRVERLLMDMRNRAPIWRAPTDEDNNSSSVVSVQNQIETLIEQGLGRMNALCSSTNNGGAKDSRKVEFAEADTLDSHRKGKTVLAMERKYGPSKLGQIAESIDADIAESLCSSQPTSPSNADLTKEDEIIEISELDSKNTSDEEIIELPSIASSPLKEVGSESPVQDAVCEPVPVAEEDSKKATFSTSNTACSLDIGTEPGQPLFELSGIAPIPISWLRNRRPVKFISATHALLSLVVESPEVLAHVESDQDIQAIIESDMLSFQAGWENRRAQLLDDILREQVAQHADLESILRDLKQRYPSALKFNPVHSHVLDVLGLDVVLGKTWATIIHELRSDGESIRGTN